MVNIPPLLAPYFAQAFENGVIVWKGLPPHLYEKAEEFHKEYIDFCIGVQKDPVVKISCRTSVKKTRTTGD